MRKESSVDQLFLAATLVSMGPATVYSGTNLDEYSADILLPLQHDS